MNIANQTYMAQDALAINQVSALKQNKGRDMSEAREAAQDFEAFFLSRMMESNEICRKREKLHKILKHFF